MTIELTDKELSTLLLALGDFKAKNYEQKNFLLSHEASNLISKIKNGN